MIGMMIPSAAPMILTYSSIGRQQKQYRHTLSFSMGYFTIWAVFSLIATISQWVLESAALLSPMLVNQSPLFGALLLIAAGLYQFSSLKESCLIQCRTPFQFIINYLRPGASGAYGMGIRHGIYCVGCCWVLMALLFVGGVMNLLWIAIITLFVLFEKVLPYGDKASKVSGTLLILAGGGYFMV